MDYISNHTVQLSKKNRFLKPMPLFFKRTGSITKLQKAMGHSSINVSLTYLRGLEIPELNEEDMPII